MMRRFVVLVLASAVAIPALADDIPEWYAPFRGHLGSTFSDWTYDDPCDVFDGDLPDNSWFVSHPDWLDPYQDPCYSNAFAVQWLGYNGDPCASDWYDALPGPGGRQGGVVLGGASWNINNFVTDWPTIWTPITLTFNADDHPAAIGEQLGISLRNTGSGSNAAFDHVSLTYTLDPIYAFNEFITNWLQLGCGNCNGADLTGDSKVDLKDFVIYYLEHWLE